MKSKWAYVCCFVALLVSYQSFENQGVASPIKNNTETCLTIIPGKGFGPFRLGMNRKQIRTIQQRKRMTWKEGSGYPRLDVGGYKLQMGKDGRLVGFTKKLSWKGCFRMGNRSIRPKGSWLSLAAQLGSCQKVRKNRGGEAVHCKRLGLQLSRGYQSPSGTVYLTMTSATPDKTSNHCSVYLRRGGEIITARSYQKATRRAPAVYTFSSKQMICSPMFKLASNAKPNAIPTMGQCEQYNKKGKQITFCNHEGMAFIFDRSTKRLQKMEMYHHSLLPLPTRYPPIPQATVKRPNRTATRPTSRQSILHSSLQIWTALITKKQSGHYRYTRSFQSFSGYMNKTTIEVKQGRVIARKHQAWMLDTKGKQLPKESWSEQGKEVGKHTNGPAPKTLTALYALCKQILATKSPSQYKLRVSVDKRGLLKTCTYRAKGCVDDCTLGFSIDSLVFLPSQTLPK